ncbi:MAG: hypothetical protein Q8K98_07165, partial [Bacteroidota bacterium]|nr:hypothetical protein [Bacteroidota bacterium]
MNQIILSISQKRIFTSVIILFVIFSYQLFAIDVSGNQSGTWTLSNNPYRVVGNVTVPAGLTLTIEPGVIVKFDSALSITINGVLIANGTETDSILFTTSNTIQAVGQWKQLRFTNNALISNITYCIFEYGGNGHSAPVQMIPSAKLFHKNNSYRNNSIQAIGIDGGSIVIPDAVWYNDGLPYLVLGGIAIHNDGGDGKLEIKPGVVIKFNTNTGIQIG